MNKRKVKERFANGVFLACAAVAILAVVAISVFIVYRGAPAIFKVGIFNFLLGTRWQPQAGIFGIAPMIVATLLLTIISVTVGSIISVFTAVFMSELAPKWLVKIMRPAIELLAGIPSVVFGLFGLTAIVPMVRNVFGGPGNSMLASAIILSFMILPTITSTVQDALEAVPAYYKTGSYALGATRMQTILKVTLPAAKSGVIAGIVLGAGRAVGETMAVILVAGNRPVIPGSLLDPIRTLTTNIAMEMGYASGLHQDALFAAGVVLFVFIMILNVVMRKLIKDKKN